MQDQEDQTASASLGAAKNSADVRPNIPDNYEDLKKEFELQEKILVTLQKDNELFTAEKKNYIQKIKELEDAVANQEAKHSLQMSSQQQDAEVLSENDKKLKATVKDLQASLQSANEKVERLTKNTALYEEAQQRLREAEVELKQLRRDVAEKDKALKLQAEEVSEKVSKLFDAETRDINNDKDEALKAKGDIIRKLQLRVQTLESLQSSRRSSSDDEIKRLNKKVAELQRSIDERGSDGTTEIVRAIQRSKESATIEKLRQHASQLEKALEEKDKYANEALSRLKKNTEEIREEYERRLAVAQKQVKSVEAESERKTRALQARLEAAERTQAEAVAQTLPPSPTPPEITVQHLTTDSPTVVKELKDRINDLSSQLERVNTSHIHQLGAAIAECDAKWNTRLTESKTDFVSQIRRIRNEHNEELSRLQRIHQEELKALGSRFPKYDVPVQVFKEAAKAGQSAFLLAVLDRLNYLEKRNLQREQEMEMELAEVKRVSELERSLLIQKNDLLIEQKNLQISDFRDQLNALMKKISLLR